MDPKIKQVKDMVEKDGINFSDACLFLEIDESYVKSELEKLNNNKVELAKLNDESPNNSDNVKLLKKRLGPKAYKIAELIMLDDTCKPADRLKACALIMGRDIEDEEDKSKSDIKIDDLSERFSRAKKLSENGHNLISTKIEPASNELVQNDAGLKFTKVIVVPKEDVIKNITNLIFNSN